MIDSQPGGMAPALASVGGLMRRILVWSALAAFVIAGVAAAAGGLTVGVAGVWSGVIGAGMSCAFFAVTAVMMLLTADSPPTVMAGAVMGGFLIKIAGMLGIITLLGGKDFYHPLVLFLTLVAGAVASLIIDVVAVNSARIPTVGTGAGSRS